MGIDEKEEAQGSSAASEGQPAQSPDPLRTTRGLPGWMQPSILRQLYAGGDPPLDQSRSIPDEQVSGCRNCEGLEFSLRETEQRAAEAEQLYKRMHADFENFRRRNERERDEASVLASRNQPRL